jgi:hypothetical protein
MSEIEANKHNLDIVAETIMQALKEKTPEPAEADEPEHVKESTNIVPQKEEEEKMQKRLIEVHPEDALAEYADGKEVIVLKVVDGKLEALCLTDLLKDCRTLVEQELVSEPVEVPEEAEDPKEAAAELIRRGYPTEETANLTGLKKQQIYQLRHDMKEKGDKQCTN